MSQKRLWQRAGWPALKGVLIGLALIAAAGLRSAEATQMLPLRVVASFSILADIIREVGGEEVQITTLVGPDGDAHVYQPTPADARMLATADLVVINGLGFEPWFERLRKASAAKTPVIEASHGVSIQTLAETPGSEHRHHDHRKESKSPPDPHAWQNLLNGTRYVANIAQALATIRPGQAEAFQIRAARYSERLMALDAWVRAEMEAIPAPDRKVITDHDAFGYFARAYNVQFIAPRGLSTEAEPTPRGMAQLIRQMKTENIQAVFLENMTDPRLAQQIARDTGGRVGGTLYADALSGPEGPAPSYEAMFRHNVGTLKAALQHP